MGYEYINFKKEDGAVGILTINRPRALNALNWDTLKDLGNFVENDLSKENLRVLIITGEGDKAFVAGADIAQMSEMSSSDFREYVDYAHKIYDLIENNPCPSIAAVNGYALGGGCELALACDIRIASEKAKLGFPEVKLGIFPGWGGSQRITRIMGNAKAKELIYTGEMISAEEALRSGLVERVVPHEAIMKEAMELAGAIAKRAPLAVSAAKEAINTGSEMDLQSALDLEKTLIISCFDTDDRTEGMKAFLEKRNPVFKGK
ncbi:MAG: crotonase [Thermodesulfobacteriota bacterium]|nr:MAG: crotonase [Thermodesulfobacteriota bacterium]